eukprot:12319834-Heterocapsa_arctica.AAC.1
MPMICKECWETGKCAVCQTDFRPSERALFCAPTVGTSAPLSLDEVVVAATAGLEGHAGLAD